MAASSCKTRYSASGSSKLTILLGAALAMAFLAAILAALGHPVSPRGQRASCIQIVYGGKFLTDSELASSSSWIVNRGALGVISAWPA